MSTVSTQGDLAEVSETTTEVTANVTQSQYTRLRVRMQLLYSELCGTRTVCVADLLNEQ